MYNPNIFDPRPIMAERPLMEPVPTSQSTMLYETMKKLGKVVEYYRIDQGNHGFIGWNNDTILDIVDEFLKKHI